MIDNTIVCLFPKIDFDRLKNINTYNLSKLNIEDRMFFFVFTCTTKHFEASTGFEAVRGRPQ
jgi:hypothetical protein